MQRPAVDVGSQTEDDMGNMDGKICVITGAGSGIGRSSAVLLAERGATVIVHDLSEKGANETLDLIKEVKGRGEIRIGDVSDVALMRGLLGDIEKKHGSIDVLINNAGTVNDFCPLEEVTEAMFETSMAVHVRGSLFATQAVVPGMKRRKYGKIVNMSSIQGTVGNPNGATYNAAKGALLAMTKGWAKEFGPHNIMVNAVAPGPTISPMSVNKLAPEYFEERKKTIPIGRWGTTQDMAYAVAFLSSPESDFVTGQVLSPNGGCAIT